MGESFFGSLFRRRMFLSAILIYFFFVFFQLFRMQILDYKNFRDKADENSIKKITIDSPRGIFFDRNSEILLSNKSQFTLRITPAYYDKSNSPLLEKVLGREQGYINLLLEKNKRYSKFLPLKVIKGVNFDFISWFEENSNFLSGVDYVVETIRDYSFGVKASHAFGYTKEITADQLRKYEGQYTLGDNIGSNAIEKSYERYLRGEKGYNLVLVNARRQTVGKYLEGELDREPVKGADLILTLDKQAQQTAETLFKEFRGALVAIEPSTGEIIAFVSSPEFDLSELAEVTSQNTWNDLIHDKSKPMFNRATMSINPPGSTIKMLEGLIGLQEGLITPDYTIRCTGGMTYGDRYFKCHGVHGTTNLEHAIEHSCNVYFYQLIMKIGLDKWANYLREFGFGDKTGIDIPEETDGIVPDTKYYDRVYGKRGWTKGYLMSLGIGQGELSATTIQLAQYSSLLANFGKTKTPHLVRGYVDPVSHQIINFNYKDIELHIDKKNFDIVRQGMLDVVEGQGTASRIRIPGLKIAGKTGTSQNPHGEDHSLFVAFAPYDNPKIAIAVIVENVGFGSTFAAPIAGEVIKSYLLKKEDQQVAGRL